MFSAGRECPAQYRNWEAGQVTLPLYGTLPINSAPLIDSIAAGQEKATSFCRFYSCSMQYIGQQIQQMDSGQAAFIKKFENSFAATFLQSWMEERHGSLDAGDEWKTFFSAKDIRPWQLILLGVNAHVNCNIWEALVMCSNQEELKKYGNTFLALQRSMAKVYRRFYDSALLQSPRLRFMHGASLGLSGKFGEWLVYKWRKRNLNLALLYYSNPPRFKRRLAVVNKRKIQIDRKILKA